MEWYWWVLVAFAILAASCWLLIRKHKDNVHRQSVRAQSHLDNGGEAKQHNYHGQSSSRLTRHNRPETHSNPNTRSYSSGRVSSDTGGRTSPNRRADYPDFDDVYDDESLGRRHPRSSSDSSSSVSFPVGPDLIGGYSSSDPGSDSSSPSGGSGYSSSNESSDNSGSGGYSSGGFSSGGSSGSD